MRCTTEGIVLRKVAYTGSSAIATIYTLRFGQVPFMVRGLGKKGGKSAALQPLARVEVNCNYHEKNQVQSLSQISLKPDSGLMLHPLKGAVSLFLSEILYKSLREEAPDPDLFHFLDSSLDLFEKADYFPNFHLILLMKLSRFFGFFPSGKWSTEFNRFDMLNGAFTANKNASLHMLEPGDAYDFYTLSKVNFDTILDFKNTGRRNLIKSLVEYYQIHLEGLGEIKSLPILIELFSGQSKNTS